MIDGQPQQAACSTSDDTDVLCAIFSRDEFLGQLDTEPRLAANMAGFLRDMHQKMCRYAEIQSALRTSL